MSIMGFLSLPAIHALPQYPHALRSLPRHQAIKNKLYTVSTISTHDTTHTPVNIHSMYHQFIKIWGICKPVTIQSQTSMNSLPQTIKTHLTKKVKLFLYVFRALKLINNDPLL